MEFDKNTKIYVAGNYISDFTTKAVPPPNISYYCVPSNSIKWSFSKPESDGVVEMPKIKKIIVYNNRATVVFWKDGTQTKVVIGKNEIYDEEKAVAMAIAKRYHGSYDRFSRSLSRVKHVQK